MLQTGDGDTYPIEQNESSTKSMRLMEALGMSLLVVVCLLSLNTLLLEDGTERMKSSSSSSSMFIAGCGDDPLTGENECFGLRNNSSPSLVVLGAVVVMATVGRLAGRS
jgi:hypothetical protein